MSNWLGHHLLETTAAVFVLVGAVLAIATPQAWLFLPAPAVLAALAWYGWEFSAEALPYALFIGVAGYVGIGVGGVLRSRT